MNEFPDNPYPEDPYYNPLIDEMVRLGFKQAFVTVRLADGRVMSDYCWAKECFTELHITWEDSDDVLVCEQGSDANVTYIL